MSEVLLLEPVFKSMIWGGDRLKSEFGYNIPGEHTGECWAISAHPNGDCMIGNGTYKGKSLSWLWNNHRELFGYLQGKVFPLLIKIIDAKMDLSIQVHPDNLYAASNENGSLGKTECWYILDYPTDGKLVIGHNATDKDELKSMIASNQWQELIRIKPINRGDFFQIEPGTVHAIKGGTLILETQQCSDITYRLYDYGRIDNGKPRPLHIDKSIDVIRCPYEDIQTCSGTTKLNDGEVITLISCNYYTVKKIMLNGEQLFTQDKNFVNVSVISGHGEIDGLKLKKGDHFILPFNYGDYILKGNMELIISYVD